MEALKELDPNALYGIIGGVVVLIALIAILIIRKKRKKKAQDVPGEINPEVENPEVVEDLPEDDYEAPIQGLEEIYTKEANGFITIKLQVTDVDIHLEAIEPSHNKFGAIHNYNSVIDKKYRKGQVIKLFFNKGKFGVSETGYRFSLAFVYTDADGNKWKHMYIFKRPSGEGEKHLKTPRPIAA